MRKLRVSGYIAHVAAASVMAAALLLCSGCAVTPSAVDVKRALQLDLPAQFKAPQSVSSTSASAASTTASVLNPAPNTAAPWWLVFDQGGALTELHAQMKGRNLSMQGALLAQQQAQLSLQGSERQRWPQVAGNVSAGRGRSGNFLPDAYKVDSGSTPPSMSLGASVSWELDLWGRTARAVQAGRMQYDMSELDRMAATRSLEASLVQSYLAWLVAKQQQALQTQSMAIQAQLFEQSKARFEAGQISAHEMMQIRLQWTNAQTQTVQTAAQLAQLEAALAGLLGQTSAQFVMPLNLTLPTAASSLPPIPPVPLVIPSALLRQRPDIATAAMRVQAAAMQIGAAQTAYFPNVGVSANLGSSNSNGLSSQPAHWSNLLRATSFSWTTGLSMGLQWLDSGARELATKGAKIGFEQSVLGYKQSVLGALQELEDNLTQHALAKQQGDIALANLMEAKRTLDIAQLQHQMGTIALSQRLSAEAALVGAEQQRISSHMAQLQTALQLLKNTYFSAI